jgi:beta-N-acetylhexosaminidase
MIGQRLLLAFPGKDRLFPEVVDALRRYRPAGVTLFRSINVDNPAQVFGLTQALQQAAHEAGLPPLMICVDQEGGQLMAIGEGTTPLPGNLALGAARSPELARQAGQVLGRELAAMGINVNYAPCCDVNVNPQNPVVGTRSFGEDPGQVAELSAAFVEGIQSSGVAATAKHFPGHGDTASDSHHGLPVLPHSLERLRQVELPPFAAAIRAGVLLVMTGHLALPAIDRRADLPATLSPAILKGLLRDELGFRGVTITDAMDMQAIQQGESLGQEAVRAAAAGADLLLLTPNPADHERIYASLAQAVQDAVLDSQEMGASTRRILALKQWLAEGPPRPDLDVVGSSPHLAIAREIAERSITLVRDFPAPTSRRGLLPIRLPAGGRLAVILPRLLDLTPADTSSYVTHTLAQALRTFHPDVDEFLVPHAPTEADIASIRQVLTGYDLVIIGTVNASRQPAQAALVQAVLAADVPAIIVAMRMPYDLLAFPEAKTYLCTYSVLEPSMQALARALFGRLETRGRLPVSIPGLYPLGHGEQS